MSSDEGTDTVRIIYSSFCLTSVATCLVVRIPSGVIVVLKSWSSAISVRLPSSFISALLIIILLLSAVTSITLTPDFS